MAQNRKHARRVWNSCFLWVPLQYPMNTNKLSASDGKVHVAKGGLHRVERRGEGHDPKPPTGMIGHDLQIPIGVLGHDP